MKLLSTASLLFLGLLASQSAEASNQRRGRISVETNLNRTGLMTIAPALKDNCTNAEYPKECHTVDVALPRIQQSFWVYRINHRAVQTALVALMAYESGDFRYNVNHYPAPGNLGQGTINMQSPEWNQAYAQYLGMGKDIWSNLTKLMEHVGRDQYTFGSAAWYLTQNCGFGIRKGLWGGHEAGFRKYMTDCVHVDATDMEKRVSTWRVASSVMLATPTSRP